MKKVRMMLLFLSALFCISSCAFNVGGESGVKSKTEEIISEKKHERVPWTFMVYMAADNNLESAAVKNFNQMEAASTENNIIVLFDRNQIHDCSDDEWSGARLYEVSHDEEGVNEKICSKRIAMKTLGIDDQKNLSLNMGNPDVLENFISGTIASYPADHYALIIWGHGTGYRSATTVSRAVAIDDTSDSFMEIPSLALAIKTGMGNENLDFIGFDTCFGSELEVLYELKDCADYFSGTQGVQGENGWNYEDIFSADFSQCTDGLSFGKIIEETCDDSDCDFACVDLTCISDLVSKFDGFSKTAAASLKSLSEAKGLRSEILSKCRNLRSYESTSNPVYINLSELVECLVSKNSALKNDGAAVEEALARTVKKEVSEKKNLAIGVFFCTVGKDGSVTEKFSPYYTKNSGVKNQCAFVRESTGYVLTDEKNGTFLDRLFGNYSF